MGGIRKPETKRNMEGNYMSFDCKWLVCGDKTVKILSIASLESVISHEITEHVSLSARFHEAILQIDVGLKDFRVIKVKDLLGRVQSCLLVDLIVCEGRGRQEN